MSGSDVSVFLQGVLLTHRAVVSTVAAQIDYVSLIGSSMGGGFSTDDVMLSYLPLAHIFDRCAPTASHCGLAALLTGTLLRVFGTQQRCERHSGSTAMRPGAIERGFDGMRCPCRR